MPHRPAISAWRILYDALSNTVVEGPQTRECYSDKVNEYEKKKHKISFKYETAFETMMDDEEWIADLQSVMDRALNASANLEALIEAGIVVPMD